MRLVCPIRVVLFFALFSFIPFAVFGQGAGPGFGSPDGVAVEASGDLVVADSSLAAIVRVDPATGDRTIVSDGSTGSGPSFATVTSIAVEASGDLVIVDSGLTAVVRVDPVTGDRTIVSDPGTGAGPVYVAPDGIAVEASGDLVVVDSSFPAVFRVDPVTGDRTIVSDAGTGAGALFAAVVDIAVEASGDMVVSDSSSLAVFRIDPVTGDRTIVSDPGTGAGPILATPRRLAVEASGDLVVADLGLQAIVRVDPVTGDRTIVSDAGTGAGPTFPAPTGIAVEASGDLVVTDGSIPGVLRVDPVTGDRTIISADPAPEFRRGDADADGAVNPLADAAFLLNFLFAMGSPPPCQASADTDADGALSIADGVLLLSWGFAGGPAPVAPGPLSCGPDPFSFLPCDAYDNCAGGGPTLDPSYVLATTSSGGNSGSTAIVSILMDNPEPVFGWSLALCHGGLVEVAAVERGAAITAFGMLDFSQTEFFPGQGWTAGAITSFFSQSSLPSGTGQEIYIVTYDLLGIGSSGLDFCTLNNVSETIIPATSPAITPATISGSIDVVDPAGPPINDDCSNAISITDGMTPFRLTVTTTDGPDLAGFCDPGPFGDDQIYNDVWFCYRPGCDGTALFSTVGSGLDTRLAIYEGCLCPADAANAIACDDDALGFPPGESEIQIDVVKDQFYLIQVGTFGPGTPTGEGFLTVEGPCEFCPIDDPGPDPIILPPEACGYFTGTELHMLINGLPPGTEIMATAIHGGFTQVVPLGPGPVGPPGMTMESFTSTVTFEMIGTGDLVGFNRTIVVDLPVGESMTTPIDPMLDVQTITSDMRMLQGSLAAGDPDFAELTVVAGTDFGLPSPGAATLTKQPDGSFAFDSDFNINYQLEFVGAPGGALDGLSGVTTGIVRMQTGNGTLDLPPFINFLRGDVNDDTNFDIGDAIALLNHLFGGDPEPNCVDAADTNDDSSVDIGDAVTVLNRLFSGALPLPLPGSNVCGPDPTMDGLDCASSSACD